MIDEDGLAAWVWLTWRKEDGREGSCASLTPQRLAIQSVIFCSTYSHTTHHRISLGPPQLQCRADTARAAATHICCFCYYRCCCCIPAYGWVGGCRGGCGRAVFRGVCSVFRVGLFFVFSVLFCFVLFCYVFCFLLRRVVQCSEVPYRPSYHYQLPPLHIRTQRPQENANDTHTRTTQKTSPGSAKSVRYPPVPAPGGTGRRLPSICVGIRSLVCLLPRSFPRPCVSEICWVPPELAAHTRRRDGRRVIAGDCVLQIRVIVCEPCLWASCAPATFFFVWDCTAWFVDCLVNLLLAYLLADPSTARGGDVTSATFPPPFICLPACPESNRIEST